MFTQNWEQLQKNYVFINNYEGYENCVFNLTFNQILIPYYNIGHKNKKIHGKFMLTYVFLLTQLAYSFTETKSLYFTLFMDLKNLFIDYFLIFFS